MRIGIDGKRALNDKGEKGKYDLDFIIRQAEDNPDTDYMIYTPCIRIKDRLNKLNGYHNIRICLPAQSGFKGEFWRKFGITNNLGPDKVEKYLGLAGELPLNIKEAGIPTELFIDAIPWIESPENLNFIKRKYLNFICCHSCQKADEIIVKAAHIKDSLIKTYQLPSHKIIYSE